MLKAISSTGPRHSKVPSVARKIVFSLVGISLVSGSLVTSGPGADASTLSLTSDSFFTLGAGGQTVTQTALAGGDGYEFTLTDNASNRAGAVWYKNRIDMSQDFTINAEINLGSNNSGADGMAFVIQGLSGTQLSSGGGLGYSLIAPAFAVEFDTYYNNYSSPHPSDYGDYNSSTLDHWGMLKKKSPFDASDGVATRTSYHGSGSGDSETGFGVRATRSSDTSVAKVFATQNLEDGQWRKFQIEWTTATQTMVAKFDEDRDGTFQSDETITAANLGLVGDETTVFEDNPVYFGFTAATGGATNQHQVRFKDSSFDVALFEATARTNAAPQFVTAPQNNNVLELASGVQAFNYVLSDDLTTQAQWQIEVSSSAEAKATVTGSINSDTGASVSVTPVANGSSTITATFTDADGSSIQDTFTVLVAEKPAISSNADNSTFFDPTADLSLTISDNSSPASGKNIKLYDSADNLIFTITADSITENSPTSFSVDFPSNLSLNTSYYLQVDAGAFVSDNSALDSVGISDKTTINFKTSKVFQQGLELALDAADTNSYNPSSPGSIWADLTNNNHDLTLKNGPLHVNTGVKSFDFDGTNDYGEFAADNLLNEAEYTKLLWFKPTVGSVNNLFSSAGTNAHSFWADADRGGGDLTCTSTGDKLGAAHEGENDFSTVKSSECLQDGIWQLAAVTFDSDPDSELKGWRLYTNQGLVGTNTSDLTVADTTTPYKTQIAAYGGNNPLDGEIAEVYLFNRALPADEISAIFGASSDNFQFNLDTVTFNPNGGVVDYLNLKESADTGSVALRTPSKQDATFLGWFTEASGGSRVGGAGDSYSPEGDVTLFAQWEDTFTITYAPGTNGSVSPTSESYRASTGALNLPTPSRDDYVFEGWFTAASGGTKIGDAGDGFSPSATSTVHAQWTQASLAGISNDDLTEVVSYTITSNTAIGTTLTVGSSSVNLNVPANAFDPNVVLKMYSVANNNRAESILSSESEFVNSFVVSWLDTDATVPVATSPLTLEIVDGSIEAGAKVYSIVGDQSTVLATAAQDGRVTISFDTDPLIAITNPASAPEENSGGGGAPAPVNNSGGGGGGGASAPVTTTVADLKPALDEDQAIEVDEGTEQTVSLTGTNLDLIESVKHGDTELTFEVSESAEQITLTIPASLAGEMSIEFFFGEEKLEHAVIVSEVIDPSIVNAGSFKGLVVIYAKNYAGKRLSAQVGEDWVIVDALGGNFVRTIEPVRWIGYELAVRIFIDRKLVRTVNLVTR